MSGGAGWTRPAPAAADDLFWPPAPALRSAAEAIRALLGDWPEGDARWRFCLASPPALRRGPGQDEARNEAWDEAQGEIQGEAWNEARDIAARASSRGTVWIVTAPSSAARLAEWQRDGTTVIDVSGRPTLLIADGERYTLLGARSDDWLAALAAFADCGFALADALCLALAWRGPGDTPRVTDGANATDGAGGVNDVNRADRTDRTDAADAADAEAANTAHDAAASTPVDTPRAPGGIAAIAPSPHWPTRLADFPDLPGPPPGSRRFPPCPPALGLYPIVPDADWVARLIALGVRTIQLRMKTSDPLVLREQIARAVAAARRAPDEVRLFINDHWRLAIEAGAYGVHLGQEDLADADLDAIAAAGLRLGLSTHGYYEILRAWRVRPSYIACGAVFPTTTKVVRTAPQGVSRIAAYRRLLGDVVPVIAIGGIDLATLPVVLATGVRGAAVVSVVTQADDVPATVGALRAAFPA